MFKILNKFWNLEHFDVQFFFKFKVFWCFQNDNFQILPTEVNFSKGIRKLRLFSDHIIHKYTRPFVESEKSHILVLFSLVFVQSISENCNI